VFEQLKLPRLLRRRGAALVHATNCFLPLRRPCPGVVTIHDLAFEAWPDDFSRVTGMKYRLIAPRAARSAERVICPSEFTRDDVCQRYDVDPGKVRVIPEAPALPARAPRAPSRPGAPAPYVLAVGDLRRKKNVASLVATFAALHRERAIPHRLVLAGADAGEEVRLRALAGDAPVELPGYVSDDALDALIGGADVLVNPSLYEGFGLVVLEAMARGTPVLAARAGALPEVGGDAACYFDPGDPTVLRSALGELLGDQACRERMSARGLEWVSRFSWERTARETAAVYRELL
jgi:glycosyltransferase involved in cell wall biosynthesis